jgi:Helicase conserved C-terminal domain
VSPTEKATDTAGKLLPHQATFLDTFFDPASKRIILLRSDVGLGKTTALVAVVRRLHDERPGSRALCLVPAALRSQYLDMLRNTGTSGLVVDRYRFREMLDSSVSSEFWPRGVIAILSRDFAQHHDVLDRLSEIRWDLVVADEVDYWLRGFRAVTLRRLVASADRVLLGSATAPESAMSIIGGLADSLTVVEWQRDRIVDHDGTPLYTLPRPLLYEVAFRLSPAELSLSHTVGALCRIFEGGTPQQRWIGTSLRRRLESSLAAIERTLQRLVESSEELEGMDALSVAPEEEMPEDEPGARMGRLPDDQVVGIARDALQAIEAIGTDSKLRALSELLGHLNDRMSVSGRICILTDFLETLHYLSAELDGQNISHEALYGAVSLEDRERLLSLFRSDGRILVATRAVMSEGIDLSDVTDVVFYDLPVSERPLRQILGRFDRFGRTSQLSIHVLRPSNGADEFVTEGLAILRGLLKLPDKAQQDH